MADAKSQLDPALVEKAAYAVYVRDHEEACDLYGRFNIGPMHPFDSLPETRKRQFREYAKAALLSLGIPAAALNALAKGEAVVVPRELTPEMVKASERVEMPDPYHPSQPAPVFTTFEAEEAHAIYRAMLAASPYRSEP